jgi:hypothetical protein
MTIQTDTKETVILEWLTSVEWQEPEPQCGDNGGWAATASLKGGWAGLLWLDAAQAAGTVTPDHLRRIKESVEADAIADAKEAAEVAAESNAEWRRDIWRGAAE